MASKDKCIAWRELVQLSTNRLSTSSIPGGGNAPRVKPVKHKQEDENDQP